MNGGTRLLDYLGNERVLRSTDDLLAATMPLLEQVLAVHESGKVAPLEGVDDVMVTDERLWFEQGKARAPKLDPHALARIQRQESLAFEIDTHYKRVDDGISAVSKDLRVLEPGEKIERPSFLTRYVSWEHEVGHHDPLTDIYVLGLVMASVALDENLGDADALGRFVERRSRLTAENQRIHPVVARAIVRMTEPLRTARAQDLRGLVATLKTYREQGVVLDEPVRLSKGDARKHVYSRLRDRLFDFSRRNRLLFFSPAANSVNLTLASVPLVLDVRSVSPDAILTWGGRAAEEIASTKPVPLGRWVRFEDHPYVTTALDQLRLDAKRSKAELGYSPLRLALCFLHWHDLKESKETRITSPLLLLPVTLDKKKGVRDSVFLTAESDQAEVNPVLRQYLQQLYGVKLPETVDLGDPKAIDALAESLTKQVQASEPAVTVTPVKKPRIDMILAQAKKRLEMYRKRVALSGRSARSHRGFDYSYARSKFAPLGVQLFTHLVLPSAAPGREMHEEPRPRIFQIAPTAPDVVEKTMYSLKEGGTGGGPYEWALDFSSVTLASFNYRKMSLVRDYAQLLDTTEPHPAFSALFSDEARPVLDAPPPIPIEERFDVMPADPTQASAVARARRGESFIIQGPPGTGKSQTITNLVADYVARGKRVLFVCEKRAAIDVVYHRLRMQGLAPLTCLIHDSQADKKAFIKDLKDTYEGWVAHAPGEKDGDARREAAARYGQILGRASRFRAAMSATTAGADVPLATLLDRALELEDIAPSGVDPAKLPSHRALVAAAPIVRSLEQGLRAIGRDAHFGAHPLRWLGDEILFAESPSDAARDESRAIVKTLDGLLATQLVRVGDVGTSARLLARIRFLKRIERLVTDKVLALLDPSTDTRKTFDRLVVEVGERIERATKAAKAAVGWKKPIPSDEVGTALALARRFESSFFGRFFGWLSPAWWRLRGVVNASFDFTTKSLAPAWSEILETLRLKYAAEEEVEATRALAKKELGTDDLEGIGKALAAAGEDDPSFRAWLVTQGGQADAASLLRAAESAMDLEARLRRLVRGANERSPSELRAIVADLEAPLADLPALLEPLRKLASEEHAVTAALVRDHVVSIAQLERDVCRAEVDAGLRAGARDVLGGVDWDGLRTDATERALEVRRANAAAVVERARNAFLANVALSNAPTDTLTKERKAEKKQYNAGRKELEHEIGKVTRYRSIRDLATGAAGVVVRDLKPVWLMSPLSVADTLPLDRGFDVVIFDEASQIPLEDAIPAAHRAPQLVVVGDEMQLPPTEFFGARGLDTDEEEEAGYELDASSLLSHAARTLPSTMLGWHYRSRDEALIAFSNRVFYEGKLLTVPSVMRASARPPIVAGDAKDGASGAAELLERSISFHRIDGSPYEQRRNTGEARYIAEMLRALLAGNHGKTIGVVAFSEAQQGEIEQAVRDLAGDDPQFGARYEAESEREEDGQHVGLFVKNLENVQGDERDIIVISVCYGPDPNGRMLMNFGPINKTGGEKRLNVIFSRAKHHLAVVSSIGWSQITNEYNDGANCLRNYLRYAEAMSTGRSDDAALALQVYGAGPAAAAKRGAGTLDERLAKRLRALGHEVDLDVGTSGLRCNLGVRARGEARYRLGILVDDPIHRQRAVDELLDAQASVLRAFGWTTHTVLHKDWYSDPELVVQRIDTAMKG